MTRPALLIVLGAFPAMVLVADVLWGVGESARVPAAVVAAQAPGTGVVGGPLPDAVAARVTDNAGRALPGVTVRWTVTEGGGRVDAASSTSDSRGMATIRWTLGPTAGPNALAASVDGYDAPAVFRVDGVADVPVRLDFAEETRDGITGDLVSLAVTDRFGNGVEGAAVRWMLANGAGAVSAESTVTDARGITETSWTGPKGAPDTLHAELYGRSDTRAILTYGNGAQGGAAVGPAAPAGASWIRRLSGTPPGRYGHALSADLARSLVVLFGGASAAALHTDMWTWGPRGWTEVRPSGAWPLPRTDHALAPDGAGGVVLFGGASGSQPLQDMWRWDGSSWTEIDPGPAPSGRARHAMVLDSRRGVVVLFGGEEVGTDVAFGDTWEWDGRVWTRATPPEAPPARGGHALAYDEARGVVVLFGGEEAGASARPLGDTWEWDGSAWSRATSAGSPAARFDHTLAYDAVRGRVVLFGGSRSGIPLGDTWTWDGASWERQTPDVSPDPRVRAAVAYDPRGRVILFGGTGSAVFADTWEYRLP